MKNYKILFASLIAVSTLLASCVQEPEPEEKAEDSTSHSTIADFDKSYEGTIDAKYKFVMDLSKKGKDLSGTYAYKNQTSSLKIAGTIDKKGDLIINEFNTKGNKTGVFIGHLEGDIITGLWKKEDNAKGVVFELKETTLTEKSSNKKELLASLVGTHSLIEITGNAGANTMFDYNLSDEGWSANGSSIEFDEESDSPMREGYEYDLSPEELKKLNSMKVVVTNDLTVSLQCMGKKFITIDFKENGMDYYLSQAPEDYYQLPLSLSSKTVFINDDLILYASDNIPNIGEIDIAEVGADVASIWYSMESKTFIVELFYGDCCDASSYSFKM